MRKHASKDNKKRGKLKQQERSIRIGIFHVDSVVMLTREKFYIHLAVGAARLSAFFDHHLPVGARQAMLQPAINASIVSIIGRSGFLNVVIYRLFAFWAWNYLRRLQFAGNPL